MTRFDLDSSWLNVGDSLDVDYQNYFNANGAGCMGSVCGTARAYESLDYTALATANATFSTADPLTSNIKDVNNIFLDTWAQGIFKFDAAQEFRLQELACSDALIDGSAVYSARSLLGWYYQCNSGAKGGTYIPSEEPENAIVLNEMITISMFPNPSSGLVQLDYDLGEAEFTIIQVFDLSGKLVHSEIIQDSFGTMELDLTSLSTGVYIYKVLDRTELLGSGKLVVK
jgi:hypothetical protein